MSSKSKGQQVTKFRAKRGHRRNRSRDIISETAYNLRAHIAGQIFGRWIEQELRKLYPDHTDTPTETLIDLASHSYSIEHEQQEHAEYFMLQDSEDVVLSVLEITHAQIMHEMLVLQEKLEEKKRHAETAAT
jgi:hypothetical protein